MKEDIRQCSTVVQPRNKIGGSHTTIIGGRHGKKLVQLISQHTEVKKIVPSVITVRGKSNPGGLIIGKVLRPDERGNLRLLISHGTSSQELRIVTNVGDVQSGERIMNELNQMIVEHTN
jgi:hypothetical protein